MNGEFNELLTQWIEPEGPVLLMVFLLMLGYAIKACSFIENRFIPHIIFVTGPALSPFIVGIGSVGDIDPRIPYPVVAIWAQAICRGFILSAVVVMGHAALIKRIEDAIAAKLGKVQAVPGEPATMPEAEKQAIAKETTP